MSRVSLGSQDRPPVTCVPRNNRSHESRLRWEDPEDVEAGSISSENNGDTQQENEDRVHRCRQAQDIWSHDEVWEKLRAMPGGEELAVLMEAEDVSQVLAHGNSKDTGLLLASWLGNVGILRGILDAGGSTKVSDSEGRTPLHLAACVASTPCVEVLLCRGAPEKVWDKHHRATPLHCAASAGSLPCVRLLLLAGADVNAGLTGRSALHYAVQSDAVDCVKELLKAGACPNTPQVYTETPLHVAAAMGSVVCIRLLLEHGADPRVQFGPGKMTALHLAAEDENGDCARLLLDGGAELGSVNHRLQTPLHVAAMAQSTEIMELFLQRGADPNSVDNGGRTPLHSAIVKVSRSCDCVRLLLDAGAHVNQADAYGYTPLHIAALNEFSNCVCLLITYGGDVTAKTNGGVSAMSFIVRRTPDVLPRLVSKLDASVKLHDHEIGDIDCELKLDFRILVPSVDRGESGLLLTFIEVGQRQILTHPLCETFLYLKWRRIRKFFLFSLLFQALFVSFYSMYVVGIAMHVCKAGCNIPEMIQYAGYILLGLNLVLMAKEVFQMAHSWYSYIWQWENWLQWLIILSVFPCVLHPSGGAVEDWHQHVAAIGIFLSWLELMILVGRFPMFGLYIQMFTTVAINFAKFLLAYSCLLVAFGLSFTVLFRDYKAFHNVALGLLKTVVMMSGELEFENIFWDDKAMANPVAYPVTSHVMFLAFVILVTVILTNLLVGLAVNDIQGLQQSAGLDRLVRQAQLVAHLESMLFSRLLRCLPHKLLTLCHRSALLLTSPYQWTLYIRPNDPRQSRVPKELVDKAYMLVAERRDRSRKSRSKYNSVTSCRGPVFSEEVYMKVTSNLPNQGQEDKEIGERKQRNTYTSGQIPFMAMENLQVKLDALVAQMSKLQADVALLERRSRHTDNMKEN